MLHPPAPPFCRVSCPLLPFRFTFPVKLQKQVFLCCPVPGPESLNALYLATVQELSGMSIEALVLLPPPQLPVGERFVGGTGRG